MNGVPWWFFHRFGGPLAGKPLEIDALLGAVKEIAGRLGQPTPNLDALFGLTRLMAGTRGLYPAMG